MKKMTILSLTVATLLFTSCGDEVKKQADEIAAAASERLNASAAEAATAAKEKAAEVATKVKAEAAKVVEVAKEKATSVTESITEKAKSVTATITETVNTSTEKVASAVESDTAGKALYAKCASCHGADGKSKALGKSAIVAGQKAADLEASLAAYKEGTRNVAGMGTLMKGQAAALSDSDIKALAAYMSSL